MATRKKVSVIIPCFNLEAHIEATIDSVLRQSIGMENVEVIIVDDASTDSSCDIISQYAERNNSIFLIKLEQNQGPGNARNAALAFAKGEYCFFLDGDDYILEDTLQQVYDKASQESSDLLFYNYGLIENINEPPYAYRKDLGIIELNKSKKSLMIGVHAV